MKLKAKQQGATLIMAIMILLMMTIIVTSNLVTSTHEIKMSSNMRDSYQSFEAAEHALRDAETWINSQTSIPIAVSTCATQPCVLLTDANTVIADQSSSWWTSNGNTVATNMTGVTTQPRYVIEFLRFVPDSVTVSQGVPSGKYFYRITARASGARDESVTVLQSVYARRY